MSIGPDSSSAHLVLIEDNPGDVWLFRYALDATGESYELNVLDDGGKALDYVHKHWISLPSAEPCLIILDLHLPKLDGMEILETLRQAPALAHIKVAVVTTGASPAEAARIAHLNVDLYREKPTNLDGFIELGQVVMQICLGRPTRAAVQALLT